MSINSVNLTGRLTRDPDVRYTDGGTSIARFTLAVDRRFKQADQRQTSPAVSLLEGQRNLLSGISARA